MSRKRKSKNPKVPRKVAVRRSCREHKNKYEKEKPRREWYGFAKGL